MSSTERRVSLHPNSIAGTWRTVLYVPGDRPDRIAKAHASGVKAVAVDWEDAVALSNKPTARSSTAQAISTLPIHDSATIIRVNGIGTEYIDDDIDALASILGQLSAIMLPMTESADHVREMADKLTALESLSHQLTRPLHIVPLIETAAGIQQSFEIAESSDRVCCLAFGPADLSRQLGVTLTAGGDELLVARSQLVLASAAAGLSAPIDGPYLTLTDTAGLRQSAAHARSLGFGGKQVLHPDQIDVVAEVFASTPEQISRAREVLDAFDRAEKDGVSAIQLDDGTFVDYPVAARAAAILADK